MDRILFNIKPKWILSNNELRNVSEFSNTHPRNRPICKCPVCNQKVVLKLGKKNIHHYAHKPEDVCITTSSETALHLNTKIHIFNELKKTKLKSIFIFSNCNSSYECNKKKKEILLKNWDNVELELGFANFKPDISLLKNDKLIGAIEFFVTHNVDNEKILKYEKENISWFEIKGDTKIYEGDSKWNINKPLPILNFDLDYWTCDKCLEREKEVEKQNEYYRNNYETIYASKMVDFYYHSGNKFRETYYVVKKIQNGLWKIAYVKTQKKAILKIVKGEPINKNSLNQLCDKIRNEITKRKSKCFYIHDRKWQRWEYGKKYSPKAIDKFPFIYNWDVEKKKWIEN